MNLTRRGFLKSCLALAAAPAIVRAESLMKLWVPPQEIVLPNLEFWGAQVEHAVAPSYTASENFIGSVWIKRDGGGWAREVIEMKATTPGVMPVMRIDLNGLSVQQDGEVVSKRRMPFHVGPSAEQTAKVTFPSAQSHLTIGDPKGIGFYGANVSIQPPKDWSKDKGIHYPLRNNFDPQLPPLTKKLLERL